MFGWDAWGVKTIGILAVVFGLVAWLASAPSAPTRAALRGGAPASWPVLTVTAVAAGPWLGYAVSMTGIYWDGVRYTGTVDRIAAQVALPLAVVAVPAMAGWGWLPLRLSTWTSTAVAAGFGSFAVLYPDEMASPGAAWGVVAIIWSVALVAVAEVAAHVERSRARSNK